MLGLFAFLLIVMVGGVRSDIIQINTNPFLVTSIVTGDKGINCITVEAEEFDNPENTLMLDALCFNLKDSFIDEDYYYSGKNKGMTYSSFASWSGISLMYEGKEYHGSPYGQISYTVYRGGDIQSIINKSNTQIFVSLIEVGTSKSAIIGKIELALSNDEYLNSDGAVWINGIIIEETDNNYEQRILNLENNQTTQQQNINNLLLNQTLQNQKILALETWKQAIEDWKESITTTLSDVSDAITGLITKTDNLEERISALENKSSESNETFPSYLMTLSSTTRKNIICAYAEENYLYAINGLGWNCGLTYKTSNSGRVSVKCSCKKG